MNRAGIPRGKSTTRRAAQPTSEDNPSKQIALPVMPTSEP